MSRREKISTTMTSPRRGERGSVLILTLLMILTVSILLFANVTIQQTYIKLSTEIQQGGVAENASRAGVAQSLYQLEKSSSWKTGFAAVPLSVIKEATYTVSFDSNQKAIPFSTNNFGGTSNRTGYDGRTVPPGYVHIVSVGSFVKQRKVTEAFVQLGGYNPFGRGSLFSNTTGMTLTYLSNTDSWNSQAGSYSDTKSNTYGDIGSNTTRNNGINLGTKAKIYGDISIGPGGRPTRVVKGKTTQYNSIIAMSSAVSFPSVTFPNLGLSKGNVTVAAGATKNLAPGRYGTLTLNNGSTLVLKDGSYEFKSITASYSSTRTPKDYPVIESSPSKDPVLIFVDQNINLRNADLVNKAQSSKKITESSSLQIYGSSKTTQIDLRGGTSRLMGQWGTSCVVYAPAATVYLNGNTYNSGYSGSIVASAIGAPRATPYYYYPLHYDRALTGFQLPEGLVSQSSKKVQVISIW